jgi:hypothetical protein
MSAIRGVEIASCIATKRLVTIGRVTSSGRVATECSKAGCGVIIAPGVLKSA